MAKNPDNPKKPGKTPKSKAHRPDVQQTGGHCQYKYKQHPHGWVERILLHHHQVLERELNLADGKGSPRSN